MGQVEIVTNKGYRKYEYEGYPGYIVERAFDIERNDVVYRVARVLEDGRVKMVNFVGEISDDEVLERYLLPAKALLDREE